MPDGPKVRKVQARASEELFQRVERYAVAMAQRDGTPRTSTDAVTELLESALCVAEKRAVRGRVDVTKNRGAR